MKNLTWIVVFLLTYVSASWSALAWAGQGLVIHAAEFGVGKFHRYDNTVHAYDGASAWRPYILPANASYTPGNGALTVANDDGSVSIFYSTLDELIQSVIQVSQSRGEPVRVLNVHGHGLPGAMWFPADATTLASSDCSDWVTAATGSDQGNYDQYYEPVGDFEIEEIRAISNEASFKTGCTTGLPEWQAAVAKTPAFKSVFASDAQLHFLSCVVGLGSVGDTFTNGIAALLLPNGAGRVETSTNFGLGDWSMPEGMGFWDMQSEAQLDHDNTIYPTDRKDREIMQKGTVRVASFGSQGWATSLLANQDFLYLNFQGSLVGTPVSEPRFEGTGLPLPSKIRVIGTRYYVKRVTQ